VATPACPHCGQPIRSAKGCGCLALLAVAYALGLGGEHDVDQGDEA